MSKTKGFTVILPQGESGKWFAAYDKQGTFFTEEKSKADDYCADLKAHVIEKARVVPAVLTWGESKPRRPAHKAGKQ